MRLQFFIHYCNNNLKYDRLMEAKYIHFVQMSIQFGEIYSFSSLDSEHISP